MLTRIDTAQITVVKGRPTEDELAALAEVLTQILQERSSAAVPADKNLWGSPSSAAPFNPHAFDSAPYF